MIKRIVSATPGVIAAVLPNATCPACWPVYAGVLSSLGLGFLMQGRYFFLFVGILLAVSLFSLYYKAKSRRGLKPFFIGLIASAGIIVGKVSESPDVVFYLFASFLVAASIWNNWSIKKTTNSTGINIMTDGNSACPNCSSKPSEV